jgi:hypothetical protein
MTLITAITVAPSTQDMFATKKKQKPDVTVSVQQEMSNPTNNIPGRAVLLIYSNQKWSGNILDTQSHSVTQDGKGDSKIFFICAKQDSNGKQSTIEPIRTIIMARSTRLTFNFF